ncbi:uncharacterized protein BDW70DRAFT_131721 [Aspergillus foveolatus]|uniref:uncharacterized protein n=1 Tax=Aspergillus foveolatus TaxID=210207 RepID=UPI003CCE15D4
MIKRVNSDKRCGSGTATGEQRGIQQEAAVGGEKREQKAARSNGKICVVVGTGGEQKTRYEVKQRSSESMFKTAEDAGRESS